MKSSRRWWFLSVFVVVVLFLVPLLGFATPARAAEPFRLGDLVSGPGDGGSSYPQQWIEAGDHTFFIASRHGVGPEVYVTRGTAASTRLLADSSPGDGSAYPMPYGVVGGRLFWWAEAGLDATPITASGALWMSDGTPATTRRVTPPGIGIPSPDFRPRNATLVDGALYFVGCSAQECSIWMSDGTPGGTIRLHELPGQAPLGAEEVVVAGDTVFYTVAGDLWGFDLSGGDPVLLVKGGDSFDPPRNLSVVGSSLYFVYRESNVDGGQVWTSDGTIGGTALVTSFSDADRIGYWTRPVGSRFYFLVEEVGMNGFDVWRTDGTPQGTEPITGFADSGDMGYLDQDPDDRDIVILGERVVVLTRTDVSSSQRSVFSSNGAPGSTMDLLDCQGECPTIFSHLVPLGGHALFIRGSSDGVELWSTDGTKAGTAPLKELCGSECSYEDIAFSRIGDEVGFIYGYRAWVSDGTAAGTRAVTGAALNVTAIGDDTVGRAGSCWLFPATGPGGLEPWCSEGTPASAKILLDIERAAASSDPLEFTAVGDLAVFSALDAGGVRQIWSSDGKPGEPASPGRLRQLTGSVYWPVGEPRHLVAGDGFALFEEKSGTANLWRTDGTAAGTFPIGSLQRRADVSFHGLVYSFGQQGDDFGIWEIDGTAAGPRLVVPLPASGFAPQPVVAGDAIYYQGPDDDLWRSDGTPGGTFKVGAIPSDGRLLQPLALTELNGAVYFVVHYFGPQDAIWRTDGSPGSAKKVASIPPIQAAGATAADGGLHAHGGALYFLAEAVDPLSGRTGTALYRYAAAGGQGAVALVKTPAYSTVGELTSLSGTLYFAFDDGAHGRELWRTDGTVAGTKMAADIHEGGSSYPRFLTPAGDRLFFSATSADAGAELWVVEPSGAAHRVADIAPGAWSSAPAHLAVAGDALFFAAEDEAAGREPWALPLGASGSGDPVPPAGPWLTETAVPGFRFKVRISTPSESLAGAHEPECIPETLCVSGALPGRSEVFLRVVGPKPNGKLWPTLVKFSTSRVEVWVEQTATESVRYYDLAGAAPGFDVLPGLFDRDGFTPAAGSLEGSTAAGAPLAAAGPSVTGRPLVSPALPGFTFRVEITDQSGQPSPVRIESDCIEETVCLSGALPGRSELFLRIVGPKPNGHLWPTLVRFSTSTIDVWITQDSTGVERHYRLDGASPGSSDLSGLFDREGFVP